LTGLTPRVLSSTGEKRTFLWIASIILTDRVSWQDGIAPTIVGASDDGADNDWRPFNKLGATPFQPGWAAVSNSK